MCKNNVLFALFILIFAINTYSQTPITIQHSITRHGPEKGSLLIIGGGTVTPDIWTKFTELAGDESTAILVQKDTLSVLGKSYVAIYDYNTIMGNGAKHTVGNDEDFTASNGPFFFLHEGQKYDLKSRAVIK